MKNDDDDETNEEAKDEEAKAWIPPVCRHWRRTGVCLYASKCKFLHPPEERGHLPAAGDANAGEGSAKGTRRGEGKGGGRKRVKKRGKCGFFRRFLIDTFGVEALCRGPVLDVGGGRGELSFELENLNDVRCIVVEPLPMTNLSKLMHKLRSGWYHRTLPLQKYNTLPPPPPRLRVRGEVSRPNDAAAAVKDWLAIARGCSNTDATDATDNNKNNNNADGKADDDCFGSNPWRVRVPRHWRMLWSPGVWESTTITTTTAGKVGGNDDAEEDDVSVAKREEDGRLALYQAWAAARSIQFFASGSGVKQKRGGGNGGKGSSRGSGGKGDAVAADDDGSHDCATHLITRALRELTVAAGALRTSSSSSLDGRVTPPLPPLDSRTRAATATATAVVVERPQRPQGMIKNGSGGGWGEEDDVEETEKEEKTEEEEEEDDDDVIDGDAECECAGCGDVLYPSREEEAASKTVVVTNDVVRVHYEPCDEGPPRLDVVRRALTECSVVVGMHSDQATEWIVDFALSRRLPFAVVPCCVCPTVFPNRKTPAGRPVVSHDEFVQYLVGKAPPGHIKVKRLGFEGKDTVVYATDYA